jgi:hypothetical protein
MTLPALDEALEGRRDHLLAPPTLGGAHYPYRIYDLPDHQRVVSFRNAYGASTGVLLRELLRKGFRRFVAFGNAGGLSPKAPANEILAPVAERAGRRTVARPNAAAAVYPAARGVKVRSVLDKTAAWLARARRQGQDVVDVETFDAFKALRRTPDASLYAGLLVSDRPGAKDISQKDEDDPAMIQRKKEFFFGALKQVLGRS